MVDLETRPTPCTNEWVELAVEHAHMHCTAQRRFVSCEYVGVISAIYVSALSVV